MSVRDDVRADLERWSRASIFSAGWKTFLACFLAGAVVSGWLIWTSCSTATLARIQTFNGAVTIPVGGALWAVLFTLVFAVPLKAISIITARVMLQNIDTTERLAENTERTWGRIERVADRLETILDRAERAADGLEQARHPVLDRLESTFRAEMARLRLEVRQERSRATQGLQDALDEGEREAERIRKKP